jgi:hypothetical protein
VRLTYVFKPDLTLDLYAEPFAASGRHHDFGELLAPRSRLLLAYGTAGTTVEALPGGGRLVSDGASRFTLQNRDFRVRSFRSNLVLRWEWRRGSTLFAVWQQDRSGLEPPGGRAGLGDVWGSLSAPGDDVFALKVSFWLPVK